MSTVGQEDSLPSPEDVQSLMEAAITATKSHYNDTKYDYVREALLQVFSNSLGWLDDGIDQCEILVEALQDERFILDRHNRLEAKALFRQETSHSLREELVNFPLRHLCIGSKNVVLPEGLLKPIYQIDDHPEIMEAARQARRDTVTRPATSSSSKPPSSSAGSRNKGPGGGPGKCRDAPSAEHEFPNANITLAELAAFLPQSIKCWDVIDRVIWNGAVSEDLQRMINKYRSMPYGKIDINSVYMMMRGQMRKRTNVEHNYSSWKQWVVNKQQDVVKPATFDPDSISVTGFRRPIVFTNRPNEVAAPISFKDLASGVSVWPDGDDALDLTRCVAWCVAHPDEDFLYPTDYQAVLTRAGGPMTATDRHTDAAVLARLRSGSQPRRRKTTVQDEESSNEDALSSGTPPAMPKKASYAKPTHHSRATQGSKTRTAVQNLATRLDNTESDIDTEDESYRGPKRVKKNKDGPRRSGRVKAPVSYGFDLMELDDTEEVSGEANEDSKLGSSSRVYNEGEIASGEDDEGMDLDD